jgi:FkbM family methyltransferase
MYLPLSEAYSDNILENYISLDDIPKYVSLHDIHKEIKGVNMKDELPEQMMIFNYLDKHSTGVIEFGGNIGRSSIIINKLMKNPEHHVVFESDPNNAKILKMNRDKNQCKFKIIEAALSDHQLAQKGWNTRKYTANKLPPGHKKIPSMSFKTFIQLYPYKFDTLVIDCEGCIVDIFLEHGDEILKNVKTIIIEHDDIFNKNVKQNYVRQYLSEKG